MNGNKFANINYLIISSIFIITSLLIINSFLFGILWASVIAVSIWPFCEFLSQKKIKFIKPETQDNALLFTFLFSIIFLVPAFYALIQLGSIYSTTSQYITANTTNGILHYPALINYLPEAIQDNAIDFWDTNIATRKAFIQSISHIQTDKLIDLFSTLWIQVFARIITVIVMLISLFFMLKNGNTIKGHYEEILNYWFSDKISTSVEQGIQALRGTINGVVLIGLVEGILLSIPLLMGDIQSGLLIGLIAGIAGVIPMAMPILIIPFLTYMFFTGYTFLAFLGLIDLLIVWFLFENIIKPQVISKTVKINTFIILISMIGGIQTLGFVGLFLGPAIVSMAIGMIKTFLLLPTTKEEIKNT